jgi:hypothetical protein
MTQRTIGPGVLSERSRRTYAAAWSLFTDWCAVTGHPDLPADPATVIAFLADCPAAGKTHRGWVNAMDHRHTAHGFNPPGRSAAVLAALGRPTGEPRQIPVTTVAAVQAALRALPSHGWTQGIFGRRDRCLLVLSQLAGVPYKHLAGLTAGDVTHVDGIATITGVVGTWTVTPDDDPVVCGCCAVTRWLRVVDLAVTKINTGIVAAAVGKAEAVTGESPHLCRSRRELDAATTVVPLFPPIDQWGALPFPSQPLTPHSLSRRVRDVLAGDLGAHRHLPVDRDDDVKAERPEPTSVQRAGYILRDSRRAWDRRRADLAELGGVAEELTGVDRRVDELNRRAAALLAEHLDVAFEVS